MKLPKTKTEWGCFSLVLLVILFTIISMSKGSNDQTKTSQPGTETKQDQPAPAEVKDLDLNIRFSAVALMVTNNEDSKMENCKLKLNDKYVYSGELPAKDAVIINMSDFTKSDGTRFDASTTKPLNVFVSCTVNGQYRTNYFAIH